jgi:hypothetical protein
MPFYWELREEARDCSMQAQAARVELLRLGESIFFPRVLGVYTTLELARKALSARLQPLFGGADCFITPCHEKLDIQHHWKEDGSGAVWVSLKKPPGGEFTSAGWNFDHKGYDDHVILTVAPSHIAFDQPPPVDQASTEKWSGFLKVVRTAEEVAADELALKLQLKSYDWPDPLADDDGCGI